MLASAKKLAMEVSPEWLAKIAIAGHEHGFMKDAPAFLLAVLANRDAKLFAKAFHRVVDNCKMLRTYSQIAISGAAGRCVNLSSGVHRRMYQQFFDRQSAISIFNGAVGDKPSLVNVMRMARVKPNTKEKESLFTFLFNKEFGWKHTKGTSFGSTFEDLPEIVQQYEMFKVCRDEVAVPAVDFRYLDSLGLTSEHWAEVFRNAGFYFTFKNLATAARQGVFNIDGMSEVIAAKLRDRESIRKSKAFPYQIQQSYLVNKANLPYAVYDALLDAMDISLENVPPLGKCLVAVDVSLSMNSPITGNQDARLAQSGVSYRSVSSKSRCVDVAALIGCSILRSNPDAVLVPFNNACIDIHLNPRDTVATNSEKLSALCRGGTNCSAPLAQAEQRGDTFDTFVLISDNESWVDTNNRWSPSNGTKLHDSWQRAKKRLPHARMINIDLTPNETTQVKERQDILQVGGFSDNCYRVMENFCRGGNSSDFWVKELDKINL